MTAKNLKEIVTKLYDQGLNINQILDQLVKENMDVSFLDVRLAVSEIEDERNLYDHIDENDDVVEDVEEDTEEERECVIELNSIIQPGAPMQGKATFKSGRAMKFMLDQYGRVGIEPIGAEQPTQEEIQIFQQELMYLLKSRSF